MSSQTPHQLRLHMAYPPLFEISNVSEWRDHYNNFGYVVIKNVLTAQQIQEAENLLWKFLSGLGTGIERNNSKTWSNEQWPQSALKKGIVSGYGAGQSDFMWYLRCIDSIRKPFAEIWCCDKTDLVPSFDGFSIFRPINENPQWITDDSLWYHVDQNGHEKPGFACVQGQVALIDSNQRDGGFVLIPKSQKVFGNIFQRLPDLGQGQIDFIRFNPKDSDSPWYHEFKNENLFPIKLCVPAGSLILWDSRTAHCNCAAQPIVNEDPNKLRRITAFISFAPRSQLIKADVERRKECFNTGGTSTHWIQAITHPHERSTRPHNFVPPELSDEQKRMIF